MLFAYSEKETQDIEKFCTTELEALILQLITHLIFVDHRYTIQE